MRRRHGIPFGVEVLENDASYPHGLYDGRWNDDFHHALHATLTGEAAGYYADAPVWRLGRCLAEGFGGSKRRGEPSGDLSPGAFVAFMQNHDQIGNRAFGERISPSCARGIPRLLEPSRSASGG